MTIEIVGHAIVSEDGMIADHNGAMPDMLRKDSDWKRFQAALNASRMVVTGRVGHEVHPNPGRKRLVVTTGVAALQADPNDANATLWNPAGMAFGDVMRSFNIASGQIAITGGRRVFDLFLDRYTRFDLVEVDGVRIPDGVSCFSDGLPQKVLQGARMKPAESEILEQGVKLTVWRPHAPK